MAPDGTFWGRGADVESEKTFTVFVVDDDASVRKAVKRLLTVHGYEVQTFESAEDFIGSGRVGTDGCLVLDMRLPGMSGSELYETLLAWDSPYPVVFMTAHDNEEWRSWVAKGQGVAYLRKPFDQQALLHAVEKALASARNRKQIPAR